jgi:predicted house-cleaning noncanonical NTP pyrophosphatase (MazG superfamily)
LPVPRVVTHFWVHTKKMRKYKKKISKKYSEEIQTIIGARKGCWNAEKMPKLVEYIQKCKRLKFDNKNPIDKENSI